MDAVPGVGVGSFGAPEAVHGDLRELGGGPHLIGVTGDEEDGSVGALDRYLGFFDLLRLGLKEITILRKPSPLPLRR